MFKSEAQVFIMGVQKKEKKDKTDVFYFVNFATAEKTKEGEIYYTPNFCYIKEETLYILLKKQTGNIIKVSLQMYKTKAGTYIPQILGIL